MKTENIPALAPLMIKALNRAVNHGQFVTVQFYKENGQLRKINGKIAAQRGVKFANGGSAKTEPVTIYDVKNRNFRTFDAKRLKSIKIGHVFYAV